MKPGADGALMLIEADLSVSSTDRWWMKLAEPERNAQTFAFGVVTVETITIESSDADLQTAVNATLIAYAKTMVV